ncbi:IS110 family transposase [Nocardioides immobilis]|uniref:IS110 family transposase n=1 Tax=Nocardioides immobilis TaxID=2049295 RepID=UPI001FE30F13|nr:transposase [Nocardioides immobilis]
MGDAEWIAQLLEHGLLTPSFVPPPQIRHLRMLTRYRVQLMGDRTREMVRLKLMLEDASIKLSTVASSLKTASARAIVAAMIDGETDARVLAEMAKGRMRKKIPDLAQPLEGHFDANHPQLARSILDRLDRVEQSLAELDQAITAACEPWAHHDERRRRGPSFVIARRGLQCGSDTRDAGRRDRTLKRLALVGGALMGCGSIRAVGW